MKTARDVMQTHLVSVAPQDPLHSVQRLFSDEGIHGAPVVDEQDRLLGIVTSTDLLRAVAEAQEISPMPAFEADLDLSRVRWSAAPDDLLEQLRDSTVADVMTESVVSVSPDAPVSDVARTLREQQVHRVLVVEDRKLLGIVSALDLVALLEGD